MSEEPIGFDNKYYNSYNVDYEQNNLQYGDALYETTNKRTVQNSGACESSTKYDYWGGSGDNYNIDNRKELFDTSFDSIVIGLIGGSSRDNSYVPNDMKSGNTDSLNAYFMRFRPVLIVY